MNTETCVAPGYSKRAGETGCPIRRRPEIGRFVFLEFNAIQINLFYFVRFERDCEFIQRH